MCLCLHCMAYLEVDFWSWSSVLFETGPLVHHCFVGVAGLEAYGHLNVSLSHLLTVALTLQVHTAVGLGNLNSGIHTYTVGTLPTNLLHQHPSVFLSCGYCPCLCGDMGETRILARELLLSQQMDRVTSAPGSEKPN